MRSLSGSVRGARRRAPPAPRAAPPTPGGGCAVAGGSGCGSAAASGSGSGSARSRVARGTAGGAGAGSGSLTRKSSWRAPQDGQNRERTLMRSPQLAQNLVSVPAISPPPPACVPLAAWGGITSRRWTAGEPSVACSQPSGPRRRRRAGRHAGLGQSPPAGDAQDPARLRRVGLDGGRRRRRHAEDRRGTGRCGRPAQLAAALDAGRAARLRRHQALAPDRPRVPRLEPRPARSARSTAPQAEQQIRSFKAKGRTPIAYALEHAAQDLGTSGPRTIMLVSDGKDTCQPPSPCEVARRIAKGGVEMRIQAIGFNVDQEARRELKCIAAAGGGVYTDADNAATLQGAAARALHARAAPVRPEGQPRARRPERAPGDRDRRPGATSTACSRTPSAGTPSSCAAGRR